MSKTIYFISATIRKIAPAPGLLLLAATLSGLPGCNRVPSEALPTLPAPITEGLLPIVAQQLDTLHQAVVESPRDARAASELGMAYFAYDQYAAAIPALQRAYMLAPRNWTQTYLLALAARHTGDLDTAVQLLEQLAQSRPDDTIVATRLAQVYVRLGEARKAIILLQQVVGTDLDNAEARLELARLQMKSGQPEQAQVLLEGLLQRYGPTAVVYAALAEAHRHLGDAETSQRYQQQVAQYRGLSLPSHDPVLREVSRRSLSDKPLINAAKSLLASGDTDKGIHLLQVALQRNPNSVPAYAWLLAAHGSRGEFDEVERLYLEAREAGAPTVNLLANLGKARARNGQFDDARSAFEAALKLDPQDASLSAALGSVALRQDRSDEAERLFGDAISYDPANRAAHFNLGEMLIRQQRYEEAIKHLELSAHVRDRISVAALNQIGFARIQMGQPGAAQPHLHRAAALAAELGERAAQQQAQRLLQATQ